MKISTANNLAKSMALFQLMTVMVISGMTMSHATAAASKEEGKLVPVGGTEYRVMDFAGHAGPGRRLGAPYQTCQTCKCCAAGTTCKDVPCCYVIICNLPDKPFGTCYLRPRACNCDNCST